MVKGSIRSKVLKYLRENPETEVRDLEALFSDCTQGTVKRYYFQYKASLRPFDVEKELIRIIKDYKTPASSRVQAIRELNNMRKEQPETKEGTFNDPFMKILEEKRIEEKEAFNEWKKGEGFSESDNTPKIRLIYEAYLENERKQFKQWKIDNGIPTNAGTAMDKLRYENEKQEESLKLYNLEENDEYESRRKRK